ncbi:MAG TPA: hypothetical protein VKP14_07575, partial [Gaiellaceae bacterium]|nr:hypothetical protein [Gaiellaceae bacterium]
RIVDEGLAGGKTYVEIAAEVLATTGETIAPSSIGRYESAKARPARSANLNAQLVADRLVGRLSGLTDSEMLRALKLRTAETLLPFVEAWDDKPGALAQFFVGLDRQRIEDAKLDMKRREIDLKLAELDLAKRVAEGKLNDAAARAARELQPQGRPRTRAELEQAIRDVYGITASSTKPTGEMAPGGSVGGSEVKGGEVDRPAAATREPPAPIAGGTLPIEPADSRQQTSPTIAFPTVKS